MPNIGAALKDEISRVARKVQKPSITPLQRASAAHRREIAQLKRDILALQKEVARLRKGQSGSTVATPKDESASTQRFQARGLKSLRARLDLGASDFGKLIGVSGQTIYNWEAEKASPRRAQLHALAAIRGIGKKEAQARLNS